jgi:hypothetical protein
MTRPRKIVMTKSELAMYKERIIRDCKIKFKPKKEPMNVGKTFRILRKLMPLTIIVGVAAAIIYIILNGWNQFLQLILTGVIWITLISTFISAIGRR